MIRQVAITALAAVVLAFPSVTHAQILFTEIMYDVPGADTGHEWVEIQNRGSSSINLTDKSVRLVVGTEKHLIKPYQGGATLAAASVGIIASNPTTFLADHPSFKGQLYKSSFSLTAATTLALMSGTDTLATATYTSESGAAGDGNSLQLHATSYIPGAPTPGFVPSTIPAPLTKPSSVTGSSNTREASKTASDASATTAKNPNKTTYGTGTLAPAASANAAVAGALSGASMLPFLNSPLVASPYFAAFIALLAFSVFSLILIASCQKRS
jgi:hypothetical protein